MAVYLDTALLIPLLFAEPASLAARERLRNETNIAVSRWTLAEFASAAAFKIRTGQTDEATAQQALGKLHALVAAGNLPVADVIAADFERDRRNTTGSGHGRQPDKHG